MSYNQLGNWKEFQLDPKWKEFHCAHLVLFLLLDDVNPMGHTLIMQDEL